MKKESKREKKNGNWLKQEPRFCFHDLVCEQEEVAIPL